MSKQSECKMPQNDVMNATVVEALPEYVAHRIEMFDRLQKIYKGIIAEKPREKITITVILRNGEKKEYEGTSWETLPIVVCKAVIPTNASEVLISKVDGVLWDLFATSGIKLLH